MPALKNTKRKQTAVNIKAVFNYGLSQKGWTQEHLAKLMGKKPAVISRAFNDPYHRTFELLYDIADKIGVDLSKALKGETQ